MDHHEIHDVPPRGPAGVYIKMCGLDIRPIKTVLVIQDGKAYRHVTAVSVRVL